MLNLNRFESVSLLKISNKSSEEAWGCKNRLRYSRGLPKFVQPTNPRPWTPSPGLYKQPCPLRPCSECSRGHTQWRLRRSFWAHSAERTQSSIESVLLVFLLQCIFHRKDALFDTSAMAPAWVCKRFHKYSHMHLRFYQKNLFSQRAFFETMHRLIIGLRCKWLLSLNYPREILWLDSRGITAY